jgi:hypothetical protein
MRVQGADFGAPARNRIEEKLRSGMTLQQIEENLKGGGQKQQQKATADSQAADVQQKRQQEEWDRAEREEEERRQREQQKKQQAPAEVGKSLGAAKRNPLQMIKVRASPLLPVCMPQNTCLLLLCSSSYAASEASSGHNGAAMLAC